MPRKRLVLPQPDGPKSDTNSPRFTARLTRFQHILLRIGELIAWAESAGVLAKRAARAADGKLNDKERQDIEGAFRLFQNKLLHGPISALGEASRDGSGSTLLEALRKLFRLGE